MSKPLHGTWVVDRVDPATVERLAAAHTPDPLAEELGVDLVTDPNREDDEGYIWTRACTLPATSGSSYPGQRWSSAATSASGSRRSSAGTSRSATTIQSSRSNSFPLAPTHLRTRWLGEAPPHRSKQRTLLLQLLLQRSGLSRFERSRAGARRARDLDCSGCSGLEREILSDCQGEGRGFESRRPLHKSR